MSQQLLFETTPSPLVGLQRVRVLSLWQPYASLMAEGHKKFETRSWPGRRAGLRPGDLLAVHAAKRPMLTDERVEWDGVLRGLGLSLDLPYGAVLSVHRFRGSIRTEDAWVTEQEAQFGDYTPGRFAWEMPLVYRLPEPFALKGAQGVFWAEAPFRLEDAR